MEIVLTREIRRAATNPNSHGASDNYGDGVCRGAGKIRQPYATGAGSDISAQLEVAVPAADARARATYGRKQAQAFFGKAVRIGTHVSSESS